MGPSGCSAGPPSDSAAGLVVRLVPEPIVVVNQAEEAVEPRVLQHDVQGQGEPIVLVPGGLTGWLSWIPHQERLAGRYRAIRVQPIHNEL